MDCNLEKASFVGADVSPGFFAQSNCAQTQFVKAKLVYADFAYARFAQTRFTNADLIF